MAVVERELSKKRRDAFSLSESETHIGQLLLRAGRLSEGDITHIIEEQSKSGLRFGDTATRLGIVSEIDVQAALARQFNYPYPQRGESSLSPSLVAAHQPFSAQAEALRGLRTQLMLRWFKDRSKVLAVMSPTSGSGSSLLAANLAVVFAQLGERTLVIDANLRHSMQHQLFGLRERAGLAGILASREAFKEAPQLVQPFENLFLLSAGPPAPNPQELLGRTMFSYIIETAPAAFDVVIVDAPPILEYADAQLIAARAQGVLLVARRHHTALADLRHAERQVSSTGAIILGTTLCD